MFVFQIKRRREKVCEKVKHRKKCYEEWKQIWMDEEKRKIE